MLQKFHYLYAYIHINRWTEWDHACLSRTLKHTPKTNALINKKNIFKDNIFWNTVKK